MLVIHVYRRQCWVCFGTEEDEPGSEWTNPCRCRGDTKWVHQPCLQQWIDEKQKMTSSVAVNCPQCCFIYQMKYPPTSPFLLLYEYLDRGLTYSSPLIFAGITATALYWISFTHGLSTLVVAMGRQEAAEYLKLSESSLVVVSLPLLPWVVLGLKILRPELQVIRFYHRFLYQPLRTLLKVFPPTRSIAEQMPRDPHFVAAKVPLLPYISRATVGTIFLPFISSIIGTVVFAQPKEMSKRLLLVSVFFCSISYTYRIYIV